MSFEYGPSLNDLASEWLKYKEIERHAVEQRRVLEDEMTSLIGIAEDFEGTQTAGDQYKIKVTARMNRRIDADALQEIAAENGLSEHLGTLFRWKPDINAKAWKDAAPEITRPLLEAITTKPGRPSFSIEPTKQGDEAQSEKQE